MNLRLFSISLVLILFCTLACKKDKEESPVPENPQNPATDVNFNLDQVPFNNLSEYRFFTGEMKNLSPNDRIIPYDVITPLFSDYAKKKKFIWMPPGTSASYNGDHQPLNFPNGTVLIKTFYYDNVSPDNTRKIIETRLIYKKDDAWHFAEYAWNDDQTEASLYMDGQNKTIEWWDENDLLQTVNYRLPSEQECLTCHKNYDNATPIGLKPQNLNRDYPYNEGSQNQLNKWISLGYLENNLPPEINTVIDWTDLSQSLEDRVRAYVDMNCAHCHHPGGHCDYRPLRLSWEETTAEVNLGICVNPEEFVNPQLTKIISRGIPNRSMMFFRLNTTGEQYRMPLLGRTVIHQEAVDLLEEYISSLEPNCP